MLAPSPTVQVVLSRHGAASGVPAGVAAAPLKLGQWAELQLSDLLAVPGAVPTFSCWGGTHVTTPKHYQ